MPRTWSIANCVLALVPLVQAVIDDTTTLVLRAARVQASAGPPYSKGIAETPEGPRVETADGPILGAYGEGFYVFKSVPYAQPPQRFERPEAKQPWGPELLNASHYGPGCIGSGTSEEEGESENCLTLTAWVPTGMKTGMPVIVYFHGGMNQHGCGHDRLRQGDLITQFSSFPTIFVNFDFRLGMLGWISSADNAAITRNLGFMDQQLLLRWVQKHIASFGGDPTRVALMGQSEGSTAIVAHLVSPGSAGLFHRALLHSPPADVWLRSTNRDRTTYMARKLGCRKRVGSDLLSCLKEISPEKLWAADWISEGLAGGSGVFGNLAKMMDFQRVMGYSGSQAVAAQGWHLEVDGELLPDEPRKLIAMGRWNRVPVLITTTKNESVGALPDSKVALGTVLRTAMRPLFREGDLDRVHEKYAETLRKSGIRTADPVDVSRQMLTDKLWMCDIRSLVKDMVRTGGEVHLGVFWHSPKYDPVGKRSSRKCVEGAACHASDMMYLLPQGHGVGFRTGQDEEVAFSNRYSQEVLSFIHGGTSSWVPFDMESEAMTLYDTNGPRVVPGYRKQQCQVLDTSNGELLPEFMQSRAH